MHPRKHKYDQLTPKHIEWQRALQSVGFTSKQDKADAAAAGIGTTIQKRRANKAKQRQLTKAARKQNRANR